MNFICNKIKKNIDFIKCTFISILILISVSIYKIEKINFIIRYIITVLTFLSSIYIFIKTIYGNIFITFLKKSIVEMKQVIWPSYKDTLNTTIIIIITTSLISIILWSLDAFLIFFISIITQLRF